MGGGGVLGRWRVEGALPGRFVNPFVAGLIVSCCEGWPYLCWSVGSGGGWWVVGGGGG